MSKSHTTEQLKDEVIHALIKMNIFKMPDGRQLYEVPLSELLAKFEMNKDYSTFC
jgi:hypothetical protein